MSATKYRWRIEGQTQDRGPVTVPDGEDARDWIGQMWRVKPATITVWRDVLDPDAARLDGFVADHRYIEYLKAVEEAARQLIFANDQERVYRWGVLEDLLKGGGQ